MLPDIYTVRPKDGSEPYRVWGKLHSHIKEGELGPALDEEALERAPIRASIDIKDSRPDTGDVFMPGGWVVESVTPSDNRFGGNTTLGVYQKLIYLQD